MEIRNPYFYSQDMNAIYDIYALFGYYNEFFFDGILQKCTVEWSKKMTLCAGTCEHKGFGSCSIKLSEPLLKFRTPNQLKQTVLHEMIHAYLFITNPKACLTEGGHGKQFKQIMKNINDITNLRVTIYHSFTDQVESYRTHIWRCNGICKQQAPYFGYVKRSMNRKPQPADPWFKEHQRYCGGQFIKTGQPQNKIKNILKNGKTLKTKIKLEKAQDFFTGKTKTLGDYVKQIEKQQIKTQITTHNKNQINFNCQQRKSIFSTKSFQNEQKHVTGLKQDNVKQIPKSKSKNRSKRQNNQKDNHKITEWFGSKGKTIQQYSMQIEEQKLMSSMNFQR